MEKDLKKKVINPQAKVGHYPIDERAKEEGFAILEFKREFALERAKSKAKVKIGMATRGKVGRDLREAAKMIRIL